jgi:ferredoxin-NADP reductase
MRCAQYGKPDTLSAEVYTKGYEVTAMPPCKTVLKARNVLCKGTTALYFQKPDGFEFKPGQFADFTLLGSAATDPGGSTRTLSIASAPFQQDLMVAMRIRDTDFKRAANTLPIGAPVLLQGPFVNLTLHNNIARPAVLLAGGIGITPFRSMISQATEARGPHTIFLFYLVRQPEEAAFLEELQEMERHNARYKLICTVTQPDSSRRDWRGETGRISIEMLSKWLPDLLAPVYYIAGPPGMVDGTRQMLTATGVSAEAIRAEEFDGY